MDRKTFCASGGGAKVIAEGVLILHIKRSCADIRDQLRKGTRGERVFVEYCARRNSTARHDLGEPCLRQSS
jgi:hypothetical protein